jgi:hypothetical protein
MIEDLAAESLFVDIGANLGWHTLVFFFWTPPQERDSPFHRALVGCLCRA